MTYDDIRDMVERWCDQVGEDILRGHGSSHSVDDIADELLPLLEDRAWVENKKWREKAQRKNDRR